MMADEIIVLGKDQEESSMGVILERGSHHELLKAGGTYADMWQLQTSEEKRRTSHEETL